MEPVTGCKTTKQTVQEGSGVEVATGKTVTVGSFCPLLSACLSCQAGACHWRCQRDRQEGSRQRTSCARSNCVTRPLFFSFGPPKTPASSRSRTRYLCRAFLACASDSCFKAGVGKVIKGGSNIFLPSSPCVLFRQVIMHILRVCRVGPGMFGHEEG